MEVLKKGVYLNAVTNHEADVLDGDSLGLDLDSLFAVPDPGC
jgi:hypothetical protein